MYFIFYLFIYLSVNIYNIGPSIKTEKLEDTRDHIDISSDDEIDILDDSDSDPAWTPSVKTPKVIFAIFTFPISILNL